jgi:hypothetical protein
MLDSFAAVVILTAVMATLNARSTTVDLPMLVARRDSCRTASTKSAHRRRRLDDRRPVLRGYLDQYWEVLSLEPKHVRLKRLNNGAPFLNSHDGSDVSA